MSAVMSRLDFLVTGVDETERRARRRELRALAVVYLGAHHPVTRGIAEAIADPAAIEAALALLADVPALRRRRMLAAYGALMQ